MYKQKAKTVAKKQSDSNVDWLPDLAASFVESRNRVILPRKDKFQTQHDVASFFEASPKHFNTCQKEVSAKWQAPIPKVKRAFRRNNVNLS